MAEITNGHREIFLDGLQGTLGNDVRKVSPAIRPIPQPVWFSAPRSAKSPVRRSIEGPENERSSQLVLGQKRMTSGDPEFDISSSFAGLWEI